MCDNRTVAHRIDAVVSSAHADEWSAVFRNHFMLNGGFQADKSPRIAISAALQAADAVTFPFTLRVMDWRPLCLGWLFKIEVNSTGAVTLALRVGVGTPQWIFSVLRAPDTLVRFIV